MYFMYNIYSIVCNCFLIIIGISSAFVCPHCYLKEDNIRAKFNANMQTTIFQIYKQEISNKLRLKIEHITFNGKINNEDFDASFLKRDTKSYKNIDVYYTALDI